MQHKTGSNRNQIQFMSLDGWISEDNPVRVIDAFADSLPLQQMGFKHTTVKSEGCPPYSPLQLLKLYLYGYNGGARIRSSRKLETECKRNIELMWLIEQMQPSHMTIATFRKVHSRELKEVFKKFGMFLKSVGLIEGKEVCTDGTKIRGVNSKGNNHTQKDVNSYLEYLDKKTEEYLKQLDEADKDEQRGTNPLMVKQGDVKNLLEQLKGKKEKYISLKQQMHTEQSKQVSTTDADTRLMQGPDGGTLIGYNIQCTNDTKHSLIVDFAVTNEGDRHALYDTSVSAKAILGVETLAVIADKGYHCPTELAACKRDNIITLVAPQEYFIPNAVPDGGYHADNFIYDKAQDCYSCPQGNKLVTNGTWLKRKKQLGNQETEALYKEYKTPQCATCPVKHLCTSNERGRIITRFQYHETVEANNKRVVESKDSYKKRKCVSEHPFGTVKRAWGYTYTLLKGIKKVTAEIALMFTCYNMRRAISIMGVVGLINAINAWKLANG